MNYINYFDLVILFILFIMSIIGFSNGFIREVVNLLVWLLSITFSFLILNLLSNYLLVSDDILATILVFLMFLLIFFIFFQFTIFFVFPEIKMIGGNYFDKLCGLILGFLKGFTLLIFSISIMFYLFNTTHNFPEFFERSMLFRFLKYYSIKIMEIVVELL